MNKQRVITNLETLLAAVKAQPESLFNLSFFKKPEPCGTIFCTVGLAASMPVFIEQGLGYGKYHESTDSFFVTLHDEHLFDNPEALSELFGTDAFEFLFEPAGNGVMDAELGLVQTLDEDCFDVIEQNMTDKALAVLRLEKRIEFLKGQA